MAICLIFKNEARYLREYIEFHRLTGIDHFFLYDNNSTDEGPAILEPYIREGIVTYHPWPQPVGQFPAYTHCITHHAETAEWIAFIDIDEFLFAPGGDLATRLAEYDRPAIGGVGVNYVNFGTSGHVVPPKGLVIENYLRRAHHETTLDLPAGLKAPHLDPRDLRNYYPLNARIKSIVRPKRVIKFLNPHYPVYKPGFFAVTENFERVEGAMVPRTSVNKIRLNHYWTKSVEECKEKFSRGRADINVTRRWPAEFLHRERVLNQVVDTDILVWLEKVRAALGVDGPPAAALETAALNASFSPDDVESWVKGQK